MKYTLDINKPHSLIKCLYNVLECGQPTPAYAYQGVKFSDNCNIKGGYFYGGYFKGGTFEGGYFKGGYFYGGTFEGGTFYGGNFEGGTFYGGNFEGGTFYGGTFRDGYINLQIQGSHKDGFLNIPSHGKIRIGCQEHTTEYWLKNYERIGKKFGYTAEQIVEYKQYIDLAVSLMNSNK